MRTFRSTFRMQSHTAIEVGRMPTPPPLQPLHNYRNRHSSPLPQQQQPRPHVFRRGDDNGGFRFTFGPSNCQRTTAAPHRGQASKLLSREQAQTARNRRPLFASWRSGRRQMAVAPREPACDSRRVVVWQKTWKRLRQRQLRSRSPPRRWRCGSCLPSSDPSNRWPPSAPFQAAAQGARGWDTGVTTLGAAASCRRRCRRPAPCG